MPSVGQRPRARAARAVERISADSPLRPRALRLRGIVPNRLKDPKKALAYLHQARQVAITHDNLAEIVKAAREIAVVHAWRGEDRHAALALLHTVAFAYLANDHAAIASALSEAGRIELEAQRFEEAARLSGSSPTRPRSLCRRGSSSGSGSISARPSIGSAKRGGAQIYGPPARRLAAHSLEKKQRLVFLPTWRKRALMPGCGTSRLPPRALTAPASSCPRTRMSSTTTKPGRPRPS